MRVCSVPLSVPFLRTVISALIDGTLVEGFEARSNPAALAEAERWITERRLEWERRLDRLGEYLQTLESEGKSDEQDR